MEKAATKPAIVEIPKGAYTTLFRAVGERAPENPQLVAAPHGLQFMAPRRSLGVGRSLSCHHDRSLVSSVTAVVTPPPPPWPLAALFNPANRPVQVVVADVNYGMTRLVDEQPVTLERYLSPYYRSGAGSLQRSPHRPRSAHDEVLVRFAAHLVCGPRGGEHADAAERKLTRLARDSLGPGIAATRP